MNLADEIRALKIKIGDLWSKITGFEESAGPHEILSATHDDTTPDTVVRGDVITGQAGPVWARLPKGTTGQVLKSNGTDLLFDDLPYTELDFTGSNLTSIATRNHNDLQNIGADDHHARKHALDSTSDHDVSGDSTGLNTTTGHPGLCPKLDNNAGHFLNGQGAFTAPGGGGGSYTFYDPDYFPASPTSQSDHFDDSSIDGKWVEWDNDSKITLAEADHHLKITSTSQAAEKWQGFYQTLPAGDFTITCKCGGLMPSLVNYFIYGLALFADAANNPSTTAFYVLYEYMNSIGTYGDGAQYWTNYGGTPTNLLGLNSYVLYLRMRRSGTTLYFDTSIDGHTWKYHYTCAQAFAPAQFGFVVSNFNTGVTCYAWIDWIYYEAANDFNPPGRVRTAALG